MANFDGSEGTYINQASAKSLGSNYVNSNRFAATGYIKAHFLGKDKLAEILNQEGCKGLRIYYGTVTHATGPSTPDLIVVGADSAGNDILTSNLILDATIPCPPACPESGKGVMD